MTLPLAPFDDYKGPSPYRCPTCSSRLVRHNDVWWCLEQCGVAAVYAARTAL